MGIHGGRGGPALSDGPDDQRLAPSRVAGHEHPGHRGRVRRVTRNIAAGIQLDAQRIPISLAGPDAAEAAELLNGAGLNAAVVGDEIGAAAALKMLRSVVIKGMEGLWVEALLAARERGVVEPLLAMIEETLDRYSARDFATMLVTTHVAHAGRRQVEVGMSRDTVAGTGVSPLLSDGVLARYERDARGLASAGQEPGVVPPTLDAALEILGTMPADRTA